MSLLGDIFSTFIWIYLTSPTAQIDNIINNLPITFDHRTSLTTPQIIKEYGYPAESHTVQTEDGYLLELHRIPYGKTGKTNKVRVPVLLYHGLLCTSLVWLINEPEKSLACRLADEGYDVWMSNARGNTYSKAHIKYTPEQKGFWDFGFHEIGIYDLPASIDYILNVTGNQQLYFIGHSLGGLVFNIMASSVPEYNDKIITSLEFAPGTATPHIECLTFRLLLPAKDTLQNLWERYIDGSFLEHDVVMEVIDKYICGIRIFNINLCELLVLAAFGWDPQQYNVTSSQSIFASITSGTSIKTINQVLQYIKPGLMSNYDYGKKGNIEHYGTVTPPLYDLSKVNTPIKIYHGGNDLVVVPIDVRSLYHKLPNTYGLVEVREFAHLDFYTAIDINALLYDDVIKTIHDFSKFSRNATSNVGIKSNKALFPISSNGSWIQPAQNSMISSSSEEFNSIPDINNTPIDLSAEDGVLLTRINGTGPDDTEHFDFFLPNYP